MSGAATLSSLAEARRAASNGRAKATRQAARISQAEIARAVGVSPACISRWESGTRLPKGEAAQRYAEIIRQLARFAEGS
jgi:DNA-binding transcriptional regulator YiaG